MLTGLPALLVSFVAAAVALSTRSATIGIVTRIGLMTVLLVLTTRAVARELRAAGHQPLVPTLLAGLLLGYALNLSWWGGHSYGAQLLVDHPVARVVVDAVSWVAVGLGAGVGPGRRVGEPSGA